MTFDADNDSIHSYHTFQKYYYFGGATRICLALIIQNECWAESLKIIWSDLN